MCGGGGGRDSEQQLAFAIRQKSVSFLLSQCEEKKKVEWFTPCSYFVPLGRTTFFKVFELFES